MTVGVVGKERYLILSRRILLSLAIVVTIGVVTGPVLAASGGVRPEADGFVRGALTMSNSKQGAVLSAAAMKVGGKASGSVELANTGRLAGEYFLSASVEGSSGLARNLRLTVYRDRDGAPGAKVFEGAMTEARSVRLGWFAARGRPGAAHTFFLHVVLATTGTSVGDAALQGLSASVEFMWTARQA